MSGHPRRNHFLSGLQRRGYELKETKKVGHSFGPLWSLLVSNAHDFAERERSFRRIAFASGVWETCVHGFD
jgi:hypothetical protein